MKTHLNLIGLIAKKWFPKGKLRFYHEKGEYIVGRQEYVHENQGNITFMGLSHVYIILYILYICNIYMCMLCISVTSNLTDSGVEVHAYNFNTQEAEAERLKV
jgi:hypothetical protein